MPKTMFADEKTRIIKQAATIALVGNTILALLMIATGLMSSSAALIGAGIDSSTDVLISIITLVVVKILSKPADAEHPWGHRRAETIATVILSFVIFFVGAQLIVSSFSDLIDGSHSAVPSSLTMIVPIISMVGKILLAISQYRLGKKAQSPMIMANAKNMSSDVLISLGVLIGFGISHLTGSAHADSIVAILIGAWIIKTALGIFIDANLELMDGNKNMRSYHVIVEAVDAVDGASTPHRARIRCVGGFWDISFDIFVDPNCTVSQAHKIASKVEKEIKARLENVYDVMIHVEPMGDDTKEVFGLSEDDLKKSV